ncbi:MAG TPA: efflux RND transporter permease subunit [Fimbriimonadaceae bacterium]|jgi:HAE1 family hydrophobic/amphiphilic exporter-1
MGLTKAAITRPVFILMMMIALIVLGLLAYSSMRKEQNPDVSFGSVTVSTVYPGASPEEVNTLVSRKIEEAISGVNGMREIDATSEEGVSVVSAQFNIGANMDAAMSDVRSKVDSVVNDLPTDALKPTVTKFDSSSAPVINLVATSSKLSNKQIRDLADDKLADRFGQIDGVSSVFVNGGDVRELEVQLDHTALLAYGIGIAQIQQAVFAATQNVPSGQIIAGPQEYNVRVMGEFKTPADLANMIIAITDPANPNNPRTVKLSDVAKVLDTTAVRSSYTTLNGKDSVSISISKSHDGNAVQISSAVDDQIQQIAKIYGVHLEKIQDQSIQIKEALDDLNFALIFGVFLVATIIFIFLHNMRGTIIVSIAIPVCLVASFIAMAALGFTINSMSMLALSLAIGVLVDDAIVVLENIYRHLRMGEDPREAAINGRSEIGLAAIAISLADVVVFTPIGFMGGILGEFFKPLGLTFACVVLISLFVSFTVTPMLASRWYKAGEDMEHPKGGFAMWFERRFHGLENFYRRVLEWALVHRWFVFVTGFVVLLSVIMVIVGSTQPNMKGAISAGVNLTVGAVLVGFAAFGINYWPKVLHPTAKKIFVGLGFGIAGLVAIAVPIVMHLPSPMSLIAPVFIFGLASLAIWVIYGIPAFLANFAFPRFRARFILAALAFGLAFPVFSAVGFQWRQWKGEDVFKFSFFPPSDQGQVAIGIELSPEASLAATQKVVNYVENITTHDPNVKYTLTQVGAASSGGFSSVGAIGENRASVNLTLYDKKAFTDIFGGHAEHERSISDTAVSAELLQKIGRVPGANITVGTQNGFGLPIQMSVVGSNTADIVKAAQSIVDALKNGAVPGVISPDLSSKPAVPELDIKPDRQRLAENNLSVAALGAAARIMYQGDNSTKFRVNGREYDIRVMLDDADRNNPNIVTELPIAFNGGNPIFLSSLASVTPGRGVDVIQRRDRQEQVAVTADLLPGYTAGNAQPAIDKMIKDRHLLPEGVSILPGGQADFQNREGGGMIIALFLGLLLVYMLLASLFDNVLYPFVIQLAQPQAMVGALLALMILDQPLNIVGMIGIICLVGLVGKNAILVVDYTNTLRGRGRNRHDALVEAGPTRLRPIMMTTLALILGIMPVALAIGRGSEFRQTIGTTIIGGMLLSTLLTLVVIPCSYTIFDDFSLYVGRVFGGRGKVKGADPFDDLSSDEPLVPVNA